MTLIEFYDNNAIDNILSTMILRPKRVVLFGYNYDELAFFKERMEVIFNAYSVDTKIICFETDGTSYAEIKKSLSELVEKYGDCAFDLSGGDNVIHTAMGAVSEKFAVSMHTVEPSRPRINILNDVNGAYKNMHSVKLSVLDTIILNSGKAKPSDTKKLLNKPSFLKMIKSLWNICNKNCAEWNKTITNIGAVVKYYSKSPKELVYVAKPEDIYSGYKNINKSFTLNQSIVKRLIDGGFMTIFENSDDMLQITFKDEIVKDILTKSGRLLELYTFMIGSTIENDGVKFFDDGESSVVIEWSGENDYLAEDVSEENAELKENAEPEKPEKSKEAAKSKEKEVPEEKVTNEVDVIFTKDVTPVFVSCKNGAVSSDELYKMSVVAGKFGGRHTKKVLVTTYFEPDEFFMSRARELSISVIFNVDKMSLGKFSERLCEAVQTGTETEQ